MMGVAQACHTFIYLCNLVKNARYLLVKWNLYVVYEKAMYSKTAVDGCHSLQN